MPTNKNYASLSRLIVLVVIGIIFVIVLIAGGTSSALTHLYYLPIIYTAMVFPWYESIFVAGISGLLMSQWLTPLSSNPFIPQTPGHWLFRLFAYLAIASWTSLMYSTLTKRSQAYEEEATEFAQLYRASLHALVDLTEMRDNDVTGKHINRLQYYTKVLAQLFIDNEDEINILASTITFHDIGKVAVPDEILNKPGSLTSAEWEIMKQHPLRGAEIIDIIKRNTKINNTYVRRYLETAREIALYHHEKFDGTGYPLGLAGDAIPLSARIAALCDVYDALRSVRPYKKAFSHQQAVHKILAERGKHFDPKIIDAFVLIEAEFEQIWNDHCDPPPRQDLEQERDISGF